MSSAPYTIVAHPVLTHKLSQLRNRDTNPREFRQLIKDMTTIIGLEASKNLSLDEVQDVSDSQLERTCRSLPSESSSLQLSVFVSWPHRSHRFRVIPFGNVSDCHLSCGLVSA